MMKQNVYGTIVGQISNQSDMDDFVKKLDIKSETVIIKPNWVDGLQGSHSEAKSLDMFLTSLDRKAVFVESYTYWRTDKKSVQGNTDDYFSSKEATLATGKQHWDFFKEQDKLFLEKTGLDRVIEKHNAEYINITNEVWEENVVLEEQIKELVESHYPPLKSTQLYKFIPSKLYQYRDSVFISFAKAKKDKEYGLTLSIKNLFGLIPDPNRAAAGYHGDSDENLVPSIVDIHKLYQSIFDFRFVVDGIFTTSLMDFETNTTKQALNWGKIIGGSDALNVDLVSRELMRGDFLSVMRDLPASYEKTFGGEKTIDFEFDEDEYLKLDY